MKNLRLLYTFLKQEGAWEKFKKAKKKDGSLMSRELENMISNAFYWDNNGEDFDYWNDIDNKWIEFIKK